MCRGIIYSYRCVCNNKYYIGQTIDEYHRRCDFRNKEKYCTLATCNKLSKFDAARKKYGLDKFEYKIIEEIEIEDKNQLKNKLNELEIYYIKEYNSFFDGYNSTEGGHSGKLSEETKIKISKSLFGRKMSELTKRNFTFKGHFHSIETKQKLSDIAKARFLNKENHPMFGKHHSKESKIKNSNSRKGKCVGKENGNCKSINVYDKSLTFLKHFNCIVDGIRWLNLEYNKNVDIYQPGQIVKCCKGKIKTAYGLIWKYSDNVKNENSNSETREDTEET